MTDGVSRVKTLIVDDEPIARAGLRRLLAEVEWIDCVGDASNGNDALQAIASLRPELVFLDIAMPGLSGVDVLRQLDDPPYVVFTTAFAEHAITAFELGAIDYLLKPFGAERLQASLSRVRAAIGEPRLSMLDRMGEAFGHGPISRLFVRSGRAVTPLAVVDVDRFEAVGDYVCAFIGATHHLLHVSLNRLEQRLDAQRFMRIHRAHIVNLDCVIAFKRELTGNVVAQMRDGNRVPVSRAKAQELRGRLRDGVG
jgi:two-component system, LytTR family, response regulator